MKNQWLVICLFLVVGFEKARAHVGNLTDTEAHSFKCFQDEVEFKVITQRFNDSWSCECTPKFKAKEAESIPMKEYKYIQGNGFYKFHHVAEQWNTARKICSSEGAHLAIINNDEEARTLAAMIRAAKSHITGPSSTSLDNLAWIGIHDMWHEGEWVSLYGVNIHDIGWHTWSSNFWGYQQPDNTRGAQNCGALIYDGTLDDAFCWQRLAFICEREAKCHMSNTTLTD